jgi:small subunit ribosomal protein S14
MTTKDWRKTLKQLKVKPAKVQKYLKHNKPRDRSTGRALLSCVRCGRHDGHIGKYGLHLCRTCFRDIATDIGFKKYN